MEYYIIRDDRIGRTIAEILIRKARAGLEVRVIYDAVGSWRLSRAMLRRMHEAGSARPPSNRSASREFTRAPRAANRKIVVTDGKTALSGWQNIAKYYLDGDCPGQAARRAPSHRRRRRRGPPATLHRRLGAGRLERLDPRGYIAPHRIRQRLPIQLAWSEEGPSRLTIAEGVRGGHRPGPKRVRICSPYFLPGDDPRRPAAGGPERHPVEVMIPACSDSPFSDLVSDSHEGDLLDAGVELYCHDNGFLHAKLVIVDEELASVGTPRTWTTAV